MAMQSKMLALGTVAPSFRLADTVSGKTVTGADMRAAADAVLAGKAPADQQIPSVGCSIKWKA